MVRTAMTSLLFAAVSVGAVRHAVADRVSYHATATGDVAFTDNVFSERRGLQDGDLFLQVRPGLRLTYGLPRMIHDLDVEGEVTEYVLHSREANLTGRAGWRAMFLPGPRSEVIVTADAGTSVINALTARTPPDQPVVEIQPLGQIIAQTASATQYASWIASRDLRVSEGLFARTSHSENQQMEDPLIVDAAEAGARLQLERYFKSSSVSVQLGGSVLRLERQAPPGDPIGSRLDRQYNPRARVTWSRDIDRRLRVGLDGGLVYVMPFGDDPYNPDRVPREDELFPVLGASADLTDTWGAARMSLRRDVAPNLLLGLNTVSDTAVISAAMPLAWKGVLRRRQPKLVGVGSISASRTQLIDPLTSDLQSSLGLARLDVGFVYAVRPGFTYGVRYELMIQTGDRNADMPIPGFFRNTFYFSFKLRYPEEIAAAVPRRRSNPVGNQRGDLVPLGAEPVVPDLIEDEGEEEE